MARWEEKQLNTLGLAGRWEGYFVFYCCPRAPKRIGTAEKSLIPATKGREQDFLVLSCVLSTASGPHGRKAAGIRGNSCLESHPAGAHIPSTGEERSAPC